MGGECRVEKRRGCVGASVTYTWGGRSRRMGDIGDSGSRARHLVVTEESILPGDRNHHRRPMFGQLVWQWLAARVQQ
jgi:hypothetical protein